MIRHIAVLETFVSWHHGCLIEGSPETHQTSQQYGIDRFKEGLHFAERHNRLEQMM